MGLSHGARRPVRRGDRDDPRAGAAAHLRVRRADRAPRVVPALVVAARRRPPRCRRSCGSATRHGVPFVARGAGTGLSGGALPVADGIVISLARLNRVLEVDLERGQRRRRAGRDEPRRHARGRRRRLLLRARPVEPAGLHDRRQRRRELGRRALPQVRLHRQPRARRRGRAARRRARRRSRAGTTGPTCSARSSARRARSGSRRSSRCASCARRRRCGRCSPASRTPTTAGAAVSGDDRGRDPAGGDRDDGRAHDRGGRGGGRRRATRRLRRGADRRARRAAPRRSTRTSPRVEATLPRARRLRGPDRRRRRPTARARLARPQGGVRGDGPRSARTTTSRTASCRARSCRRCCGASTSSRDEHGLRVGNVFHAGDGNLHPLVLYDGRVDGRGRARRGAREPRSSRPASTPAARSPASTASASTRRARCR